MRLTEQRAINSNLRADGIEGFGAMTGIKERCVTLAEHGLDEIIQVLVVEEQNF